jgi:hypothetical protein
MKRHITFVVCLVATVCAAPLAQVAFSQSASIVQRESTSHVAYAYVSSNPSGNKFQISAYSAAPDGRLTAVAGSPFFADVSYLATNKKYLFGTNGIDIESFSISSDGALKEAGSINAQKFNSGDCGGPLYLFLDNSGATLYDLDVYSDCANNAFQFFGSDDSRGELNYLGVTAAASPEFGTLSFLGNNKYAYGASCYHFDSIIYGFARGDDGALTDLNITPAMPIAAEGDAYCPGALVAHSNQLAVVVAPLNGSTGEPAGSAQLATYAADSSGNVSTNSTYSNMPTTSVTNITDISISPSGELLVVGGTGGLQVFHFNSADPITHYTGLLTTDDVNQMFWDNDNHLYAISQSAGKLFVFTVTPTRHGQAPGSPYTITNPEGLAVQWK